MRRFLSSLKVVSMFALLLVLGSVASATDSAITIPTMGIDMPASVTAFGVSAGTIISVVLGIIFFVLVLRMAVKWARKV